MNQKPHADVYIDDKGWNARGWRETKELPYWITET